MEESTDIPPSTDDQQPVRPTWRFSGRRGAPREIRVGQPTPLPPQVQATVRRLQQEQRIANVAEPSPHAPAPAPVAANAVPRERRAPRAAANSVVTTPITALPPVDTAQVAALVGDRLVGDAAQGVEAEAGAEAPLTPAAPQLTAAQRKRRAKARAKAHAKRAKAQAKAKTRVGAPIAADTAASPSDANAVTETRRPSRLFRMFQRTTSPSDQPGTEPAVEAEAETEAAAAAADAATAAPADAVAVADAAAKAAPQISPEIPLLSAEFPPTEPMETPSAADRAADPATDRATDRATDPDIPLPDSDSDRDRETTLDATPDIDVIPASIAEPADPTETTQPVEADAPATEPETETEAEAGPEASVEPESEPDGASESEATADVGVNVEPERNVEPEAMSDAESETESEPEAGAEPDLELLAFAVLNDPMGGFTTAESAVWDLGTVPRFAPEPAPIAVDTPKEVAAAAPQTAGTDDSHMADDSRAVDELAVTSDVDDAGVDLRARVKHYQTERDARRSASDGHDRAEPGSESSVRARIDRHRSRFDQLVDQLERIGEDVAC